MSLKPFSGCVHQSSCPYTPQQNGIVERKHRHLLDIGRALLMQSHLPKVFWSDCILTATHIVNTLTTRVLNWKSPWEILFKQPALIDHLRVFGSTRVTNSTQELCVEYFLGILMAEKVIVMLLDTREIVISRNVKFQEDTFLYKGLPDPDNQTNIDHFVPYISSGVTDPLFSDINISTDPDSNIFRDYDEDLLAVDIQSPDDSISDTLVELSTTVNEFSDVSTPAEPGNIDVEPARRSSRSILPPVWQKDYVCYAKATSPHSIYGSVSMWHTLNVL